MESTVKSSYQTWIDSRKSKNTKQNYAKASNDFMQKLFNKNADEITAEDLNSMSYSMVFDNFIKPYRDNGSKDSTIKNYLFAVNSFLSILERDSVFPEVNFKKIKKDYTSTRELNQKDCKHIELLTEKEILDLEDFLKARKYSKDPDNDLGEQYAMLVDFMFRTAIRGTAALTVKWSDFTQHNSPYDGKDYVRLEVIDKGHKLNNKELTADYYEKLKSVFYKSNAQQEKVFYRLNRDQLNTMIREFGQTIGRSVSVHSIKVGAATTLWSRTHDILKVKRFCDHDSIVTTERYIRDYVDEANEGTAIMMSNYDYSKLNGLSKEQLLAIIHGNKGIENFSMTEATRMDMIKD